jgi:maltoporin
MTCASVGARTELFFTEYLFLAVKSRICSHEQRDRPIRRWLRKITIAPQVGVGGTFVSRRVLRTFVYYANWSDGLPGFVGGTPFRNRKNGLT